MKKIILVLLLLLAACGNGRDAELRAEVSAPQVGIGQVDPNRGPCMAGFQRTAPGVCTNSNINSITWAVAVDNACHLLDFSSQISSAAKTINMQVAVTLRSLNSVSLRSASLNIFNTSNSSCGTLVRNGTFSGQEFVATAGNATVWATTMEMINIQVVGGKIDSRGQGDSVALIGIGVYSYTD